MDSKDQEEGWRDLEATLAAEDSAADSAQIDFVYTGGYAPEHPVTQAHRQRLADRIDADGAGSDD